MNKCFLILSAVLQLLLLSGCNLFCNDGIDCCNPNTKVVKLATTTREWINYKSTDSKLFRHGSDSERFMVITFSDTTERFFQGDECPDGVQETVIAELSDGTDTIQIKAQFKDYLELTLNNQYLSTFSVPTNTITSVSPKENHMYYQTITLNNLSFDFVIQSRCVSCDSSRTSEIYIAKGIGLIAYRKNGKLWIIEK